MVCPEGRTTLPLPRRDTGMISRRWCTLDSSGMVVGGVRKAKRVVRIGLNGAPRSNLTPYSELGRGNYATYLSNPTLCFLRLVMIGLKGTLNVRP